VVRAIERGLAAAGVWADGLDVVVPQCDSPFSGARSSASAVVAGSPRAAALPQNWIRRWPSEPTNGPLAAEFEGHPDNAAASVLVHRVSWTETERAGQASNAPLPSAAG